MSPLRSARRTSIALALLLLAATPSQAVAQTAADSAGIRAAVEDYVNGFYEGDSTKHIRSVRPDVYKYGFARMRDSANYVGMHMPRAAFDDHTRQVRARNVPTPATAPREIRLLDVLDQTAAVKLTAYWGTDYMLLGKYDGRWMVSSVIWQSRARRG